MSIPNQISRIRTALGLLHLVSGKALAAGSSACLFALLFFILPSSVHGQATSVQGDLDATSANAVVAIADTVDPPQPETFTKQEIIGSLLLQAKDYEITSIKSNSKTSKRSVLKLGKDSLLNWTNPARSTEQGVVMVWYDEDMPMAMGSLFTFEWQGVKVKHEMISLTDENLRAEYRGMLAWDTKAPVLKWQAFQSATKKKGLEKVSSLKPARLAQMRAIAREYKFEIVDFYRNNTVHNLRLMPEPVLRFASKKHGILDGGIFAYCVATDPEVYVVLRAKEKGGWEFSFLPSSGFQITAHQGKKKVWFRPRSADGGVALMGEKPELNSPYTSYYLTADQIFRVHPKLKTGE